MADEAKSDSMPDDDDELRAEEPARVSHGPAAPALPAGPSFFHIYKPGQGYWTRMGTAVGAGLLVVTIAWYLYSNLAARVSSGWILGGVTGGFIAACVIILWYYLNKPVVVDFFIATETEMKKVNWTSRKDLIGSTWVVIVSMFLISAILFLIDIVFGYFFQLIKVLKYGPFA